MNTNKFKDMTDEELQKMIDDFMAANFTGDEEDEYESDDWCFSKDSSSSGQIHNWEGRTCVKCKTKVEKKEVESFNGDKFSVWKCANPKCGYCE